MGGDSAGGNLALGLVSHLLHPHPEIAAIKIEQPLRAAILMSPWVSFSTDWPSSKGNAQKDLVVNDLADVWSTAFLAGRERDGWNEPLSASGHWWQGLENVVSEVLVQGGADEILIDSIKELAKRLEAAHPKATTFVAEGEWHEAPVIQFPYCDGGSRDVFLGFCRSRL